MISRILLSASFATSVANVKSRERRRLSSKGLSVRGVGSHELAGLPIGSQESLVASNLTRGLLHLLHLVAGGATETGRTAARRTAEPAARSAAGTAAHIGDTVSQTAGVVAKKLSLRVAGQKPNQGNGRQAKWLEWFHPEFPGKSRCAIVFDGCTNGYCGARTSR